MQSLPVLTTAHALFLDFDGTLAELAPHPNAVRVANGLVPALDALHARLQGALAIVTGRPAHDIDGFLAPLRLPLASEHGAQYRLAGVVFPAPESPRDLQLAVVAATQLAAQHPGLLAEPKRSSVALHYRQAPHLKDLCRDALVHAIQDSPDLEIMQGKCVFEVKSRSSNKGQAVVDFMATPPFTGRIPVFAGDDTTDEDGFAAAQQLGGWGIKVGEGATQAQHRCSDPAALRDWLNLHTL